MPVINLIARFNCKNCSGENRYLKTNNRHLSRKWRVTMKSGILEEMQSENPMTGLRDTTIVY